MPSLQHAQSSPHALGVMFDIASCRGKLRVVEDARYGVNVLPSAPKAGPYRVPEVMEAKTGNSRQFDALYQALNRLRAMTGVSSEVVKT